MASIFDRNNPLDRLKKKPVQPAGSVLSGLNGKTPLNGGVGNVQPFQTPQTPQPPQQVDTSVFGTPPPLQPNVNVQQGVFEQPPPPPTDQTGVIPVAPLPPDQPLGTTPVGPGTGIGPTPIQVTPQDQNILSSLNPDLAKLVEDAIQSQLSGSALDPQLAAGNEAFARATQQARVAGGGAAAGQLGQGAANAAQQQTEQAILSAVGQKGLQEAVAMQEMISNGIGQAVDLAKLNTAQSNFLANLDKDIQALNQGDNQFFANLASNKELLGLKLSSQKGLLKMQLEANKKLSDDSNFLLQQGIDLDKAKLYGYEDADGNWVMGTLQMQGIAFQNALNSQAGQSFANYITANPNTNIDDPAVQKQGQALWESLGNTGPVDQQWLQARIEAVKDPSLTNPIIGTKTMLDEAVASGDITQETADKFWENFMDTLSGGDSGSDLTPKETFQEWKDKNVPDDFQNITQAQWEAAGNPKTWEEYLENIGSGDDNSGNLFGDKYEDVGDHLVRYSTEDQNIVIAAIEAGNQAVIDRFLYTGADIPQFIGDGSLIELGLSEVGDVPSVSNAVIHDEPIPNVFSHDGKVVEIDGVKYVVGIATEHKTSNYNSIDITFTDPKTGKTLTYRRYNKKPG